MLGEAMIYICPNSRAVYSLIPFIGYMMFFFCGLIVKPSTLPAWAGPWVPSVSVIRWTMQGLTINEFENNSELFPTIKLNPDAEGFNGYHNILNLFGWGKIFFK